MRINELKIRNKFVGRYFHIYTVISRVTKLFLGWLIVQEINVSEMGNIIYDNSEGLLVTRLLLKWYLVKEIYKKQII